MSPLAIFYFLLASSPVYNNWRHESSSWAFPSTWENAERFESMMPFESIFNNEWTPEFFGGRHFNAESTLFNTLIRKAIRSPLACESTRRHLVREMTGLEAPSMFETTETLPIARLVKLIKRIAKVNPIMIEKLLTRPESLFAVEKVMRHVAPESLLLVEQLINKNVPVYIREKIARRVVKSILSHKMSRRSILSEMYPTESIFSTPMTSSFSTLFNVESPIMTRHLIEKVLRHAEVARLVKKLIKKSLYSRRSIVNEMFPTTFDFESTTPFSTLFNVESPIMTRHLIEKIALNKVIRRIVKKNIFEHENVMSHVEPKLIKKIVKALRFELPVELSTLSHVEPKMIKKIVKKALRHELPVELSTLSHVEPKLIKKIVKALRHELPVELSTLSHVEPKMIKKIVKKALRHELPVEKVIRRLVKSNVFEHENVFENVMTRRNVEEVCTVCEKVCENFESSIFSTKVCRVCEKVCPTVFGRHFGLEHFDF